MGVCYRVYLPALAFAIVALVVSDIVQIRGIDSRCGTGGRLGGRLDGKVDVHKQTVNWCVPYSSVPHDYTLQHRSLLPDLDLLQSHKYGCDDEDSKQFQKELSKVQNAPLCTARSQLIPGPWHAGFGSIINSWVKPFMAAFDSGHQYWSPPLQKFAEDCAFSSSACYFQQLSPCETVPHLDQEQPGCRTRQWNGTHCLQTSDSSTVEVDKLVCLATGAQKCIPMARLDVMAKNYSYDLGGFTEEGYPRVVPERWRKKGHFWYYNQFLAYLLRPNDSLQQSLKRAKELIGWDEIERPMLSLHVRHGDSCSSREIEAKNRRCEDLDYYMEKIRPMIEKYGFKSIFLATDDTMVINATQSYTNFTWIHQQQVTVSRGEVLWDSLSKDFNTSLAAKETLVDLFLLSEGDAFAGKFSSNIDRLAYSLMANRVNGLAPFMSLDSNWCFDWWIRSGISDYGKYNC